MDDRIERRPPWVPWAVTSGLLLLVAVIAYGAGASTSGNAAADDGRRVWMFVPFGGIWAFFLIFWIFGALRWTFWGGWCRPWRHRRYYDPPWRVHDDERRDWEDWHRREHERMSASSGSGAARPDSGQRPI